MVATMPKRDESDDADRNVEPKPIKICSEDKEKFMKKVLFEIKNVHRSKDGSCDTSDKDTLSALELNKKYRAHCTQSRSQKPSDNPEDKMFGVSAPVLVIVSTTCTNT